MTEARLFEKPHRRYDPLGDRWVLVSAQRTQRPWQGQEEELPPAEVATYDPGCYLCPGNSRAHGAVNPEYESTFVFENDYPALLPDAGEAVMEHGLLRAEVDSGTCRVLCFSPRHDLSLSCMDPAGIRTVVDLWADQTADLGRRYRWVQAFENRGVAMGASNPHPHGQVWASSALPNEASVEDRTQRAHLGAGTKVLLREYLDIEREAGERVVVENDTWTVVVPYWAVWPFETLVLPHRHVTRLPDLQDAERDGLAQALGELLGRYDRLFDRPMPYSMGWHGAPFGDGADGHWQFHGHFFPPLLRSATIRKFMVGYELLAEAQRDLTPEAAADRLRAAGDRS